MATSTAETEPEDIRLPRIYSADAQYLFNHFEQRLFSYDMKAGRIEEVSTEPNYFQYGFPTRSELFTAGSSTENGFEIIRVREREISPVLVMPPDQGVFPVATDGADIAFFIVTRYVEGEEAGRQLVRLVDNQLQQYPNATGLIESGVIFQGELFYSAVDPDSGLYRVDTLPVDDAAARPRPVASDLVSGRIYVHGDRLFLSDESSIFSERERFACADLCFFADPAPALIRIYVAGQDLVLDVLDTRDGEIIGTVAGALDFKVLQDGVEVFTPAGIKTIDLPR